MLICNVTGMAVSTVKDPRLTGYPLLVCQEVKPGSRGQSEFILAVDTIGAGEGDLVAVVVGASAMKAAQDAPVDAAIVAILDEVAAGDFRASGRPAARR